MGISSNQARFLSLTARQVDLEHRVQQICQRRLRLSSELERVATDYNNQIGNRKMFTFNTTNSGIDAFTLNNIKALKDSNGNNYAIMAKDGEDALGFYNNTGSYSTAVVIQGLPTACTGLLINSTNPNGGALISLTQLGLTAPATEEQVVESAIRNGLIIIATKADEFTQTPVQNVIGIIGQANDTYELRDWRTLPELADELFKGDDMDAENKYDRIVSQINQQDKKLQLEQASVEVEYKAITSEKEAVKKILDTNASASFKYFS